ncbi:hypothetical protein HGRIS_000368 [Hohenbuehelia grisea]|uniref:Uncharacterized protein n=1 Tax=Hohenbuehelia grisea TaxID=104357 RepID=A0ABR3JRM0_9AGAR
MLFATRTIFISSSYAFYIRPSQHFALGQTDIILTPSFTLSPAPSPPSMNLSKSTPRRSKPCMAALNLSAIHHRALSPQYSLPSHEPSSFISPGLGSARELAGSRNAPEFHQYRNLHGGLTFGHPREACLRCQAGTADATLPCCVVAAPMNRRVLPTSGDPRTLSTALCTPSIYPC